MKLLIKVIFILASIFFSSFLIIKFSCILTIEYIKNIFENIKSQNSSLIGLLVILLLVIDLFIAIPTMTVILLAGYFLGFQEAVIYVSIGLLIASMTGYFLSRKYGEKIINKLSLNKEQKKEMKELFFEHGTILIILARALPMLPEISACLAGTCKMPLKKFLLAWCLGTIPYLSIISYAGSISEIDNPMPAIYSAIFVTSVFWLLWLFIMKKNKYKEKKSI